MHKFNNKQIRSILSDLNVASQEAIQYVGSANFPEREEAAISAICVCFNLAWDMIAQKKPVNEITLKIKEPN